MNIHCSISPKERKSIQEPHGAKDYTQAGTRSDIHGVSNKANNFYKEAK